MKFLSPFLLILWFISTPVFAEQAMPPELVLPADLTKNASKQAIKFSWKKTSNAVAAKVYAYRLLISENSRFNGYSYSTGSCNNSCIFAEVDSTTFDYSTDLRLSNKVYYWKVQAVGAVENGAWSTTRTIQTKKDIVIPTITAVSAMPNPVIQNYALTFSATLNNPLPPNYNVKVDYGNGLTTMTGNMTYSTTKTLTKLGVQNFTVGVYDEKNSLKGQTVSGQFEVIAPPPPENIAPILKKLSAANSTVLGESYDIELEASDFDNNLSSVLIDWGDGSSNSQPVSNGYASFSISHSYDTAGTFSWSAIVFDKKDAQSETVSQKVTISKPVAKVPSISAVSATPNSVTTGNSITFSATLSATLPTGYSVKVDYGNGLITLSGSGTNYSISKTPTNTGQQLFSIGIYDSKSVLKSNSMTGNFEIVEPAPVMIETPKPVETKPTTTNGNVETFKSGSKTFSYTKIANDGSELPKTAKLGTGSKDWACTKDNNTGLIWEVKTTDGGLRDKDWEYSWYKPDGDNGGSVGYQNGNGHPEWCKGSDCDTYAFTNAVNKQGLCGAKDWRMPTRDELQGLVYCSDGKYDSDDGECTNYNSVTRPTINTTYFPNTESNWFWSSSPNAFLSSYAWYVYFDYGGSDSDYKHGSGFVRLVR